MKAIISLAILSLIGNHSSYNGIEYRKLVWGDFRGPVENNTTVLAKTYWSITLTTEETDGKVIFTVTPIFDESKSFTRTDSEVALKHENCHWALTCIYARLIETAILPYQNCIPVKQVKAERAYISICNNLRKMQDLFDKETQNSINVKMELIWEGKILKELKNTN